MAKRIVARLELTASAKKTIEEMSTKFGMTQVAYSSRALEAFAKLGPAGQLALLQNDAGTDATLALLQVAMAEAKNAVATRPLPMPRAAAL